MNREFNYYINLVLNSIGISGKRRKQIKEDLYTALSEKQQITGESNPYILLGNPKEVAKDFIENLEIEDNQMDYIKFRCGNKYGYEYISRIKIFGVPLLHINTKPLGIAKGIFAFGNVAIGAVAFGVVSLGILSFGAISFAILLALGGMAFSGGLAIGGLSISYVASIGGAAIAKHVAFGGYARADIAIGGVAKGIIAIYKQEGIGQFTFQSPVNVDEVISTIRIVYPRLGENFLGIIRYLMAAI